MMFRALIIVGVTLPLALALLYLHWTLFKAGNYEALFGVIGIVCTILASRVGFYAANAMEE